MRTSRPSLAELRAVAQAGIVERRSAEHWAGRLYMRAVSLRVTRLLVGTKVTPNGLTLSMIVVGLIAAVFVAVPTLWTALLAAVLVQLYLLLDCVDGEVARWRRTTSAAGVYLDRLGHHVVESAIVLGLGVRAAGGLGLDLGAEVAGTGAVGSGAAGSGAAGSGAAGSGASWWIVLGAVAALLVVIGKLESDLVTVARAGAGLPPTVETDPTSSVGSVRSLRRVFSYVPLHRLVGAIELSLLLVVAAVVDRVLGTLVATQVLLVATAGVAVLVAVGHPLTILTSQRLR